MRPTLHSIALSRTMLAVGLLAAFGSFAAAQRAAVPAAAPANSGSICGNQPLCYETSDFAATIVDFRLSNSGGFKVIDTTVHFQNKTNQPLILGYSNGSGMALDDQGNRFGINGYAAGNGVQGIGQVAGNNIDPKFVLQPGGAGDAQFELLWRTGPVAGVNYELDMTVREVTALEGHQFALGGEFPLRFRGLANGMFSNTAAVQPGQALVGGGAAAPVMASTGVSAGQAPCTPGGNTASTLTNMANSAGGQNASSAANSTVASAQNAISQFRSLFGRKKAAAAPAPAATSAPCAPAASGSGVTDSGVAGVSAANSATPQTAGASPAVVTRAAVRPATASTTTTRAAVTRATTTSTPTTRATTTTTAPAAKPAPKKPATPVTSTSK